MDFSTKFKFHIQVDHNKILDRKKKEMTKSKATTVLICLCFSWAHPFKARNSFSLLLNSFTDTALQRVLGDQINSVVSADKSAWRYSEL